MDFLRLRAIAPPVLVLSTAYVLKEQALESIERRHANERAFQAALTDWQAATAEPENHPQWSQFYANALRDALRKVNARRKETLAAMTQDDWRRAVYRDMRADLWYEAPYPADKFIVQGVERPESSSPQNGNGTVPKVEDAAASGAV